MSHRFLHLASQQLLPSDENVRDDLGDLQELTDSIASKGILQPLLVRPVEPASKGRYEIVAGHRRFAAGEGAGLDEYPCVVRIMSDEEALEAMVVENTQRRTLNPIEEAHALKRLVDGGQSEIDVAAKISRSPTHVSLRLKLLSLPKAVQREIVAGEITITAALKRFGRVKQYQPRTEVSYIICTSCPYVKSSTSSRLGACPQCGGITKVRTIDDMDASFDSRDSFPRQRAFPEGWTDAVDELYDYCTEHGVPFVPARELAEDIARGAKAKTVVSIVIKLLEAKRIQELQEAS